ncbi:MAG: hypothetical protein ACJA09_003264 [Alcanivorax sp.]|jgi:hypothetical protein
MTEQSKDTSIKSDIKTRPGRNRLVSIVSGAAVSAFSLLGASLAGAATTITRQNGIFQTRWYSVALDPSLSIVVEDASLATTGGSSRDDAFDDALEIFVGTPAGLSASNTSTELPMLIDAPATVVNNSPMGGSVSGTASATLNGTPLGMVWTLVFSATQARVDGTFVVTNNSGSAFAGYVAVSTDFGSDGNTVIEATSSGDTTIADGDTWVVTSEDSGESDGDDPVILSIVNNPSAVIGPYTDLNDGNDELVWRVPISLAAGASTTVFASHSLFRTISEAITAGVAESSSGVPIPVPVMQNPALLALAVLTGLLGTGGLVSRKRKLKK